MRSFTDSYFSDTGNIVPFENTTPINLINLICVLLFCRFYFQFKIWLNQLSLSHVSDKKDEKTKNTKRWALKSGNGHKNQWDPSEKMRETMVGRIYRKGKFWVWSGTEMEWCIVKVVMKMMMMNWWENDEMTVTETRHQQVGDVF